MKKLLPLSLSLSLSLLFASLGNIVWAQKANALDEALKNVKTSKDTLQEKADDTYGEAIKAKLKAQRDVQKANDKLAAATLKKDESAIKTTAGELADAKAALKDAQTLETQAMQIGGISNTNSINSVVLKTTQTLATTEGEIMVPVKQHDKENYLGDRLTLFIPGYGYAYDPTRPAVGHLDDSQRLCIPKDSVLQGVGSLKLDTEEPVFVVKSMGELGEAGGCHQTSNVTRTVTQGQLVVLKKEQLHQFPTKRKGWTYGTLIVPYKYQYNGSKTFKAQTSVGGYIGYRWDRPYCYDRNEWKCLTSGISLRPVLFFGATSVPVTNTTNDTPPKTDTQQHTALSYGIGLLGEIKRNYSWGVVFGRDKLGANVKYEDGGRTWVAFSIGVSFSE